MFSSHRDGAAPGPVETREEERHGARAGSGTAARLLGALMCLSAVAFGGTAAEASAQELPLRTDLRPAPMPRCSEAPDDAKPSPEARTQATQLASAADQAVILGDLERARALLDRALQLDPASADLAYRRARVLEAVGDGKAAAADYCRALAAGGSSGEQSDELGDARERLERLAEAEREAVPEAALSAAERGVTAVEEGELEDALSEFGTAATWAPEWPTAAYNRGITLARLGRHEEAGAELRRYLALRPDAPDAVAVSERIGQLESLAVALQATPSPGAALMLGMLFPGMGQFYTGRAIGGFAVLGITAGAVASGFFIKEVNIRCLDPSGPGGTCPSDQIVSRTAERPHLVPALGVAAGIVVVSAIEAFLEAKGRRSGKGNVFSSSVAAAPHVSGPSVAVRGERVDLNLLRVHFR